MNSPHACLLLASMALYTCDTYASVNSLPQQIIFSGKKDYKLHELW